MVIKMKEKVVIDNYCENRIKSNLLGGVKTEAILVFTRTALERIFDKLEDQNSLPLLNTKENTNYVYDNLRNLLNDLKKSVVNVDYLIGLMQDAKKDSLNTKLRRQLKYEEPLIMYNDTMAKRINYHFESSKNSIPELLIICILSNWFLENEKSTKLYPFIDKYNFVTLIEKYEIYAQNESDTQMKLISKMQLVSIDIITFLKKAQYKFNKSRIPKHRKRK